MHAAERLPLPADRPQRTAGYWSGSLLLVQHQSDVGGKQARADVGENSIKW